MITYLKDLPIGSTVVYFQHKYPQHAFNGGVTYQQYPIGTFQVVWLIAAQDHFAPNTTTLWADRPLELVEYGRPSWITGGNMKWLGTKLQKHCEAFYETLPQAFKERIIPVFLDNQDEPEYVSVFSYDELYYEGNYPERFLGYELDKSSNYYEIDYWTRTYDKSSENKSYVMGQYGELPNLRPHKEKFGFRPFVNLPNDVVVSTEKMFGHHVLYDTEPEEPAGFVKVDGIWKPLYGFKAPEGSVK